MQRTLQLATKLNTHTPKPTCSKLLLLPLQATMAASMSHLSEDKERMRQWLWHLGIDDEKDECNENNGGDRDDEEVEIEME